MRKSEKCYRIVDEQSKMLYGAFPKTKEGKRHAEKYLKKINKDKHLTIILK
jgi:hypothetical protein